MSKADARRKRRREVQEKVVDYLLLNPCVDCGQTNPILLEFDHVSEKNAKVSRLVGLSCSWESVKAEIDLCEVRCVSCHRMKTAAEFNHVRYQILLERGIV